MEDIIAKLVDFIYFVINTIKNLVANLRGDVEETTAEPTTEETIA